MACRVLSDADVARLVSMSDTIGKIEDALREQAEGALVAPPRFRVDAEKGSLVFTAGAATKWEKLIGFRVYDTFPHGSVGATQLVAVFDSETGDFKGVIIGNLIGSMRTGAIGGVAIGHMSRSDSKVLGILGSGLQARTQLEAAASVRSFEMVKVYSPDIRHRETFVAEMKAKLGLPMEAVGSAGEVAREADVLICATTSRTPLFPPDWLKPGTHINTIGPKFKAAHEIDMDVASKSSVIATDSIAQINAYPQPFFLHETLDGGRIVELSDIVAGKQKGRATPDDITLFCSVGLAGTEVVVANEVIERAGTVPR